MDVPMTIGLSLGSAAFLVLCLYVYFTSQINGLKKEYRRRESMAEEKHNLMDSELKTLATHKQRLERSLRAKRHSDEELKTMARAMESLSAERSDELQRVLIDSREVRVDRLLGKGGFGVVNLATYRGVRIAVKQLLSMEGDNVERFRFECFLMKNLRHPNIVRLIGVCWDDEMFACCLEYVENGTLEDWLRRTTRGTRRASLLVQDEAATLAQQEEEKRAKMIETLRNGYDHDGESYDPSLITPEDARNGNSIMSTILQYEKDIAAEAAGSARASWAQTLEDGHGVLPLGVEGWWRYNPSTHFGETLARVTIDAPPLQVMGLFRGGFWRSNSGVQENQLISHKKNTRVELVKVEKKFLLMSDREVLLRQVVKKLEPGSYLDFSYSIEDERAPIKAGTKRMNTLYGSLVRPKPGSDGKQTEIVRMMLLDINIHGWGAGLVLKKVAKGSSVPAAGPLVKLKRDIIRLLREVDMPPLAEVVWKGKTDTAAGASRRMPQDEGMARDRVATVKQIQAELAEGVGGWIQIETQDVESIVELGDQEVRCYWRYNENTHDIETVSNTCMAAAPEQDFALLTDPRYEGFTQNYHHEVVDSDELAGWRVERLYNPSPILGVSDREILFRAISMPLGGGSFVDASWHVEDSRQPIKHGVVRMNSLYCLLFEPKEGSGGKASDVWRYNALNPKLPSAMMNKMAGSRSLQFSLRPLVFMKKEVERLVSSYVPDPGGGGGGLTWAGHLHQIAVQAALGVQYLHNERYWSDEGGEKLNRHAEEKAGWRECIIHRDLKPDNMLLTNDWVLKLTDFGEARAVEANSRAAMTSVGTPIYMSPETMRGDHYTKTADSYSFAVVLMAMVRGEATVQDYYIEALRKALKLKPGRGVGMSILTHRIYNKGWRPLLPLGFKTSYPNLSRLIQECWAQDPAKRPTFETIVARLQGPVAHEIRMKPEPVVVPITETPDSAYHARMKKEKGGQGLEREGGDEGGGAGDDERKRHEEAMKKVLLEMEGMVKREEYDRVVAQLREAEGKLAAAALGKEQGD